MLKIHELLYGIDYSLFTMNIFLLQQHPYRSDHIEDKITCKNQVIFFRTKFGELTVTENLPQYSGEMNEKTMHSVWSGDYLCYIYLSISF